MDLYAILGVPRGAPGFQIKEAWRKLAKTLHPDVGGDPARFAEARLASEILLDDDKRREYDATGRTDFSEPAPDAMAFAILTTAFAEQLLEWVQGAIGDHIDLIERLQRKLNNRAREQRVQVTQMRRIERRSRKALDRLGRDPALGADPLRAMLEDRIGQLGPLILQAENQAVDHERAAELAAQWTWRADPPPGAMVVNPASSTSAGVTFFDLGGGQ